MSEIFTLQRCSRDLSVPNPLKDNDSCIVA